MTTLKKQAAKSLQFHPVTSGRLPDMTRFSERHGRFRYCSCMRWRMKSAEYQRSTKEDRVAALDCLIRDGAPVGVLAYMDGEPVGWCSIAPRETYAASGAIPRPPACRRGTGVVRGLFFRRSARAQTRGYSRPLESGGRVRPVTRRQSHRRLSGGARAPAVHLYGITFDIPSRRLPGRDPIGTGPGGSCGT